MYSVNKVEVILTVPSIEETAAWYERVLGWQGYCDVYDAEGRCDFGSVMRGDMDAVMGGDKPFAGFNLSRFQGDPASYSREHPHFTAFIDVDDVDAVYARVVDSGVALEAPLEAQSWGGKTFSFYDLNGFHLTVYQLEEQPATEGA